MPLTWSRRRVIKLFGACGALSLFSPWYAAAADQTTAMKAIPSTGEKIPVIGMGTWRTFNVGGSTSLREDRTQVLAEFFKHGGGMVDCSPMYGSSAEVLGFALKKLKFPNSLFSAEKIWTSDGGATRSQLQQQADSWNIDNFDLMQVHNLMSWQQHLANLLELKAAGKVRYVGITTSHGRRHSDLEQIMQNQDLDFVQLTYNLSHRQVEQRLLPIAKERGIAVIANRPYDGGVLIRSLKKQQTLPPWAINECGCQTWADFLLKFVASHPAITCAIPATSQVAHMQENMQAGRGVMPGEAHRLRMVDYIKAL